MDRMRRVLEAMQLDSYEFNEKSLGDIDNMYTWKDSKLQEVAKSMGMKEGHADKFINLFRETYGKLFPDENIVVSRFDCQQALRLSLAGLISPTELGSDRNAFSNNSRPRLSTSSSPEENLPRYLLFAEKLAFKVRDLAGNFIAQVEYDYEIGEDGNSVRNLLSEVREQQRRRSGEDLRCDAFLVTSHGDCCPISTGADARLMDWKKRDNWREQYGIKEERCQPFDVVEISDIPESDSDSSSALAPAICEDGGQVCNPPAPSEIPIETSATGCAASNSPTIPANYSQILKQSWQDDGDCLSEARKRHFQTVWIPVIAIFEQLNEKRELTSLVFRNQDSGVCVSRDDPEKLVRRLREFCSFFEIVRGQDSDPAFTGSEKVDFRESCDYSCVSR